MTGSYKLKRNDPQQCDPSAWDTDQQLLFDPLYSAAIVLSPQTTRFSEGPSDTFNPGANFGNAADGNWPSLGFNASGLAVFSGEITNGSATNPDHDYFVIDVAGGTHDWSGSLRSGTGFTVEVLLGSDGGRFTIEGRREDYAYLSTFGPYGSTRIYDSEGSTVKLPDGRLITDPLTDPHVTYSEWSSAWGSGGSSSDYVLAFDIIPYGYVGSYTIFIQQDSAPGTPTPTPTPNPTPAPTPIQTFSGHRYQFVPFNGTEQPWSQAEAGAAARGGYLSTITSQAENAFVASLLGGQPAEAAAFIGASDAGHEGTWQWATGLEAGATFWNGATVPGAYSNWAPGEPNNFGSNPDGSENFAGIVPGGAWLDLPSLRGSWGTVGYIVEFSSVPVPSFDAIFYLGRNPDVKAAGIDAWVHYDNYWWREGRDPNAYFSSAGYRNANPDVKAAGINPLTHYDQNGWHEGRDPGPNFDTGFYLARNSDVKNAGMDPLQHYLQYGIREARLIEPMAGRVINSVDFDMDFYLMTNPDVAAAGVDPWQHYDRNGWHEGRDPNAYFSTNGYLSENPDVGAAGIDPLAHYHQYGWKEGRNASALFNTNAYLAANRDVAAAQMDPLFHFLAYGINEGRLP
jgi:hypothetical protein